MKSITLSLILFAFLLIFTGCEAFRKKFVRKPKKERKIEIVTRTQEYEPKYSAEEAYKKYFLFWRAAHGELIDSLSIPDGNRKKRIFAAKRTVVNLQQMRQLVLPEKQVELDVYILEQKNIIKELDKYKISRVQKLQIKSILQKQSRQIKKRFAFRHIQEHLIKE